MLRSSIQSLLQYSSLEAASRVLPLLTCSLGKSAAQQQLNGYPHTPSLQQSAADRNGSVNSKLQKLWYSSSSSSSSRLQPGIPSQTHSRCITTSAAAAAAPSADTASTFLQASDLQQLQQQVQEAVQHNNSSSLSAADAAAAYVAATRLAGKQPAAAAPVLQLLAPAWAAALPAATIQDVANALVCWSKLGYSDGQLWSSSLAAVPGLCSDADGQDLANVAMALATAAEAGQGAVPGVSREEAEEVLRVVTHQLVSMVTAASAEAAGAAGATAAAAQGGSSGKGVSMSNIATLRWAHEVFEGSAST